MKTKPKNKNLLASKMPVSGCLRKECRCIKKHGRLIKGCEWRIKKNALRRDEWGDVMNIAEIEKSKLSKFRAVHHPNAICKQCYKLINTGNDRCKCKRGKAGQLLS